LQVGENENQKINMSSKNFVQPIIPKFDGHYDF